ARDNEVSILRKTDPMKAYFNCHTDITLPYDEIREIVVVQIMNMLSIKNFSKSYKNDKKAVENLNLEVMKGDIFGFIGHNGAGKTTTIRAIAGVLDFEEGEITIDNISIKKDPVSCKKRTAYIPDNPDLYEHLTGIGYLNFIGDIYEVNRCEEGSAIFFSTHVLEVAEKLCNKIAIIKNGKLISHGTTEEVKGNSSLEEVFMELIEEK
ncbi:MAG: transporter related, partial [Firmicutes bacterium]|nr:transporter related [Bacillota bacterium]